MAANPAYAEALSNLGLALRDQGAMEVAFAVLRRAISLAPDDANAHNGLGTVLYEFARFDEALASFHRAVELDGSVPEFHGNLGMTLLRCGDWDRGWQEYEWRLRLNKITPRSFDRPAWEGEDLGGRRILLHCEQGFGDTIQFFRYVPKVIAQNGRVVLELPSELYRLVDGALDVERLVRLGDDPGDFEVYSPLLSLPRLFRTEIATIPSDIPYVRPPAGLIDEWSGRIGPSRDRFRVGLVWAGRPLPRGRSIALSQFAALAAAEADFYSLQTGAAAAEAWPAGIQLIDHSAKIEDFADLAALITQIDLVISIDTAAAHLAGAMGKPVWVLLRHAADWRWLAGREDSPWYPSMRLFRQQRAGEWGPVIDRVAASLVDYLVEWRSRA